VARFSKKSMTSAGATGGVNPAAAAPNVGRQLGAVARRVREGQGLTLTDVATTAGISAGMLSRLETGHVTPSLETLVALAGALGVRPGGAYGHGGDRQ
jgi:DNA-binding XRE family transcriptional regulator